MNLISFYLPQFHEIPENNDAWGKGFTEWTNVKKSKPLYWGHYQPREPFNDNYYNLLDEEVIRWQAQLATKAGIYGFCFYHYWFEGRMVLEKPIYNLLNDKTVHINYCMAWANESWTKTWHGAGGEKEILIPQTYGREEEWEKHYLYFLDYFRDDRYIKNQNRPVLLIYRLKNIPEFNEMIQYWNMRAKKDGFDGVYIISMNMHREHVDKSIWVNGSVDFEPNRTKAEMLRQVTWLTPHDNKKCILNRFAMKTISYNKINKKMLESKHSKGQYRAVFINFDDSPRRGVKGIITRGANPNNFKKYLFKNIQKTVEEDNEYLFINAWNEWGEGNYLEPDKKYKDSYLKVIQETMDNYKKQLKKRG